MVTVLAIVRITSSPKQQEAVTYFPEHDLNTQLMSPNPGLVIFVSPDTPYVNSLMQDALHIMSDNQSIQVPSYILHKTAADSEEAYKQNSTGVYFGIDFSNDTLMNSSYTVRTPAGVLPPSSNSYGFQGKHNSNYLFNPDK